MLFSMLIHILRQTLSQWLLELQMMYPNIDFHCTPTIWQRMIYISSDVRKTELINDQHQYNKGRIFRKYFKHKNWKVIFVHLHFHAIFSNPHIIMNSWKMQLESFWIRIFNPAAKHIYNLQMKGQSFSKQMKIIPILVMSSIRSNWNLQANTRITNFLNRFLICLILNAIK